MPLPSPRVYIQRIRHQHGEQKCLALATVTVIVNGFSFDLSGVRIIAKDDGDCFVQLPNGRDRDGRWFPVIVFHDITIQDEIKAAVMASASI